MKWLSILIQIERKTSESHINKTIPIIHTSVSTYAQALIIFHEDNPVPTKLSNKRLKIQCWEQTPTTKQDVQLQTSPYVHPTSNTWERGGYTGRGGTSGREYFSKRRNSNTPWLILKGRHLTSGNTPRYICEIKI